MDANTEVKVEISDKKTRGRPRLPEEEKKKRVQAYKNQFYKDQRKLKNVLASENKMLKEKLLEIIISLQELLR